MERGQPMNQIEVGKAIAFLRRHVGLSQSALGEKLGVSDKAVSKWERGIACPDISFLPKLSVILDTDIESLLNGSAALREHQWKGILILDELASVPVYSKPMVYYMLGCFMLVGIRDILIVGRDVSELIGDGCEYGLCVSYSSGPVGRAIREWSDPDKYGMMIIYGNTLIYGSNLTSKFQSIMSLETGAHQILSSAGEPLPVVFCSSSSWAKAFARISDSSSIDEVIRALEPSQMKLGRGVVCLPMTDKTGILEASEFVRIIEDRCGEAVCDLKELALNRALI